MIAATLTILALLLHGGSGSDWIALASKQVSKSVADAKRRKAAKAILEQMQNERKAHTQRVLEMRKELNTVEARYESTAADYRAVFRKIDRVWIQTETRLYQLRFELLKHITREEWADLNAKVQAKIDKARAKAEKKAAKKKKKKAA
ncbi:MAG: hypothetical protein ACYTDU_06175 [Planctomycetota bacterium]|jgi:hypothetical protein